MESRGGRGGTLVERALRFLDAIPQDLKSKALRPFDDSRTEWSYLPGDREGVYLGELDRKGRKAVHALLASALLPYAYAQVAVIMALEDVLDDAENGRTDRHSSDYALAIFGEPGWRTTWGWRFEGHHISLNLTMADGAVASVTPCFLGANPAAVAHDRDVVVRPLGMEEELARNFIESLGEGARSQAIVSSEAPRDIHTRLRPSVGSPVRPLGVPARDLTAASRGILTRLIALHTGRFRSDVVPRALEPGDLPVEELSFAWEGAIGRGGPHYYRVQAPELLIEYDNTQNHANHVHCVWRSPRSDFGRDPLTRHLSAAREEEHAGGSP